MGRQERIAKCYEVADKLYEASVQYYQNFEESSLTDEEYDSLMAWLKDESHILHMDSDGRITRVLETQVASGTHTTAEDTVYHAVPMLSLEKATSRDDVVSYVRRLLSRGASGFSVQAKFDGIALSVVYDKGELVQLSTRGDGTYGQDISYLIHDSHVTLEGLPYRVEGFTGEIRGELFLRSRNLDSINEYRAQYGFPVFANTRNANAGLIHASERGLDYPVTLTFVAYTYVGVSDKERLGVMAQVMNAGMNTAEETTVDSWRTVDKTAPCSLTLITASGESNEDFVVQHIMERVDSFGLIRDKLDIPTDGVVIKPVNEAHMNEILGATAHHPLCSIAYKYTGAQATTRIVGVDTTVGYTGRVTPTALLEPVTVGDVTVSRATLNNYEWVSQRGICVGSTVRIERKNDVIPAVVTVLETPDNAQPIVAPLACPYCGMRIERTGSLWYCANVACPSRTVQSLIRAVSKSALDIDGMGSQIAVALHDKGYVSTIADFYTLTIDDIAHLEVDDGKGNIKTVGSSRARHIKDSIDKSVYLPLHRVLIALGIKGLGTNTARSLTQTYTSYESLRRATVDDISHIGGIGRIVARDIVRGLGLYKGILQRLYTAGFTLREDSVVPLSYGNTGTHTTAPHSDIPVLASRIEGVSFSTSGSTPRGFVNRNEWQEFISAHGGIVHATPRKDTDIMVADPHSSSSKVKKALSYGVRFIEPDGFMDYITGVIS